MGAKFSAPELKVKLKTAVERMKLRINGYNNQIKKDRKEISKLMKDEKFASARIKAEQVIKQSDMIEVMERLIPMCELLVARLQLITSEPQCDPSLVETVATIAYCSGRVPIKELKMISQCFALKYSKEWMMAHVDNGSNQVKPQIVDLLSVRPPPIEKTVEYLEELAEVYKIEWDPEKAFGDEMKKKEPEEVVEETIPDLGFPSVPKKGNQGGTGGGMGGGMIPPPSGDMKPIMPGGGMIPPPSGGLDGMIPPPTGGMGGSGMIPPPTGGMGGSGMIPPPTGGIGGSGMIPPPQTTTTTTTTTTLDFPDVSKPKKDDSDEPKSDGNVPPDYDELEARFNALRS